MLCADDEDIVSRSQARLVKMYRDVHWTCKAFGRTDRVGGNDGDHLYVFIAPKMEGAARQRYV